MVVEGGRRRQPLALESAFFPSSRQHDLSVFHMAKRRGILNQISNAFHCVSSAESQTTSEFRPRTSLNHFSYFRLKVTTQKDEHVQNAFFWTIPSVCYGSHVPRNLLCWCRPAAVSKRVLHPWRCRLFRKDVQTFFLENCHLRNLRP